MLKYLQKTSKKQKRQKNKMKIAVYNQAGEKVKDLQLSELFDISVTPKALTAYVQYLRNALRAPVANSKDRSEVSGGGKKPHKQKGTGRARAGSSRSPLWVGGGVTFGPTNDQNFRIRMNKSARKNAIVGIVSETIKDKRAVAIDNLNFDAPKTKKATEILENVKAEGKIALIYSDKDANAYKSFRNIGGLKLMTPGRLNLIDLVTCDKVIFSVEALGGFEAIYTKAEKAEKVEA